MFLSEILAYKFRPSLFADIITKDVGKMIYITGDTHIPIDIAKLNEYNFPMQKNLTKNDYVIICGDFGGVWDASEKSIRRFPPPLRSCAGQCDPWRCPPG